MVPSLKFVCAGKFKNILVGGANFKTEVRFKKHFNTKHEDQNCKVCCEVFKTSIEVSNHVQKEHSNNIKANIFKKRKNYLNKMRKTYLSLKTRLINLVNSSVSSARILFHSMTRSMMISRKTRCASYAL